jgi:branched-chain amino acid aminotransferase
MESPLDRQGWARVIEETIRANDLKACYIRPIMYRGYSALGVNPLPCPVEAAVLVWQWDAYLGPDAENGVDVCVSSWNRMAPNTFPAMAKSSANYANAALVKMEAVLDGYAEGIALDVNGLVSEGSGQNIFVVRNGIVYTTPMTASILPGITRDSVITIARSLGYDVREEMMPRELLYLADEAFFVGTAVEITPIRSIDKIVVGAGKKGPVTSAIHRTFFDVINGEAPDTHGWLSWVYAEEGHLRNQTAAATGARR